MAATATEKRWTLEVEVEGEPAVTKTFGEENLNADFLIEQASEAGATLSKQAAKALISTNGGQVPGIRLYPAE